MIELKKAIHLPPVDRSRSDRKQAISFKPVAAATPCRVAGSSVISASPRSAGLAPVLHLLKGAFVATCSPQPG